MVEEIEDRVRELIDLFRLEKTMMCDPGKSDYARCVLKKAYIHVELRKRRDKLEAVKEMFRSRTRIEEEEL